MTRAHNAGKGIVLAYATPIYARTMRGAGKVNDGLRALILEHESGSAGVTRSNVGGWHSLPDLFEWEAPETIALLGWVCKSVQVMTRYASQTDPDGPQIEVVGWANVCRDGDYHRSHMHPGHDWSGIYYVDPGDRSNRHPDSGVVEFHDPRAAVGILDTPGKPFWGTVHFLPEAGMLLLFPSWLVHTVNPYRGARERISVSFNVRLFARGH